MHKFHIWLTVEAQSNTISPLDI